MGGWRTKFVFLLIVYFTGFATAIYCLAPARRNNTDLGSENTFVYSTFKSDQFAQSFNTGMHKCIDFGKHAAWQTGNFIKQKLNSAEQTDS